jgi:proteasome accessory factor A
MGIETEYGITLPGFPDANPTTLSTHIVTGYARAALDEALWRTRWDYFTEMPLRDARGFDMSMADADPSMLTNTEGEFANIVLTNGARLYVDHAHPEYSAPETVSPRDATLYDAAGVLVMERAAAAVGAFAERASIQLYKNNSDNKGASYGTHENMLVQRAVPFADLVTHLTPFFITRQLFTGAGRLGLGQIGDTPGYQITQRADYFEAEVGLETTMRRPIINTRDEPHADPKLWRRLHVITGDANLSQFATWLKLGTLAIVLSMIENGVPLPVFEIEDPVIEMRAVSHDIKLHRGIRLVGGRTITAIEIQRAYIAAARSAIDDATDAETLALVDEWERVIDDLAIDPARCADRLDWVAKLQLIEAYRQREHLPWDAARLQLVDLQYADVRAGKGLAQLMTARGSLRRLFTDAEIERAVVDPPRETRAFFRGEVIRRYPQQIAAASWDSVVFDLPGAANLTRVPLLDPLRGTAALTEDLLNRSATAADLLTNLSQN